LSANDYESAVPAGDGVDDGADGLAALHDAGVELESLAHPSATSHSQEAVQIFKRLSIFYFGGKAKLSGCHYK
jgi:hypothetical protein